MSGQASDLEVCLRSSNNIASFIGAGRPATGRGSRESPGRDFRFTMAMLKRDEGFHDKIIQVFSKMKQRITELMNKPYT